MADGDYHIWGTSESSPAALCGYTQDVITDPDTDLEVVVPATTTGVNCPDCVLAFEASNSVAEPENPDAN